MSSNVVEKKRSARTKQGQYEVFVQFLETNREFGLSLLGDNLWTELTALLNAEGTGPTRTTDAWKTILKNWKNQVKHKVRVIKTHVGGTGGGPPCSQKLSDLEERGLQAWGLVTVEGAAELDYIAGFEVDVIHNEDENSDDLVADLVASCAYVALPAVDGEHTSTEPQAEMLTTPAPQARNQRRTRSTARPARVRRLALANEKETLAEAFRQYTEAQTATFTAQTAAITAQTAAQTAQTAALLESATNMKAIGDALQVFVANQTKIAENESKKLDLALLQMQTSIESLKKSNVNEK